MLGLVIFIISFYNCDNKEYPNGVKEEFVDSSYLAFTERTDDMFGSQNYPLYAPFEEGVCNGFQLFFNRYTNLTDTIQGIIELEDSNGIHIDYKVTGADEFYIKNRKNNEIYLFPKIDGLTGFYNYTFIINKNQEPYVIKFITSTQDTILIYQEGDKKGSLRKNTCF